MNCNGYQRLLHLNRTGELSIREAEELRQHLRLCEKCTLEFQRIQHMDELIDRIASFSPNLKNPQKLTADILRLVRGESTRARQDDLPTRILDLFLQPSVRYATVAIVILIISTFMFQLTTTLTGVSNLERRMALASTPPALISQSTYTAQSKTLQDVARSKGVKSLTEILPVIVRGDHIEVPVKDLESIAPIYDLRSVSAAIGSSALHIDRKTLEKIINEVKATAELTLRFGRKGA